MTRLTLLAAVTLVGCGPTTAPEAPIVAPAAPQAPTATPGATPPAAVPEARQDDKPPGVPPAPIDQLDPGTFGIQIPVPGSGWTDVGVVEALTGGATNNCEAFRLDDFEAFNTSNFRYVDKQVMPSGCDAPQQTPRCGGSDKLCAAVSNYSYQPIGASISDNPVNAHTFYKVEKVTVDLTQDPPVATRTETGRLYRVTLTAAGAVDYEDYWFLNTAHRSPKAGDEQVISMEMSILGPGPDNPDAARQDFITALCTNPAQKPCAQTKLAMPWHKRN